MKWCTKIKFATRGDAEQALHGAKAQRRNARRKTRFEVPTEAHVYRCDVCGGWHWTSQSKSQARRHEGTR